MKYKDMNFDYKKYIAEGKLFEAAMPCPAPTQNVALNTANRDRAIQADFINYGPLNVEEPGDYWENIAEKWNTSVEAAKKFGVPDSQMLLVEGEVGILAAMKAGRADAAVQTFFGAKEHEEKTGGAFEVTDPKMMPKETVNVVGIGFRKSDEEFRQAFNAALAKVMANPGTMLERAGKYGYDKAQLPPADMTTEWACSTK